MLNDTNRHILMGDISSYPDNNNNNNNIISFNLNQRETDFLKENEKATT